MMPVNEFTINLSDDLAARLIAESKRRNIVPEQVVTEAVEKALGVAEAEPIDEGSLFDWMNEAGLIGCIDSGMGDLSTNPRHMEGYGTTNSQ